MFIISYRYLWSTLIPRWNMVINTQHNEHTSPTITLRV
jgi:hypothetical protein